MADRALRFFETFINRDSSHHLRAAFRWDSGSRNDQHRNNVDAMSAFLWRGRLAGRAKTAKSANGFANSYGSGWAPSVGWHVLLQGRGD
jgi:hypothetical protein